MILYHGTNTDFPTIDLAKCRPNKDFGRGLYLTDIRRQAADMAVRRCEIEGCGEPVVQAYGFDEALLASGELRVKRFDAVSSEWAEFIMRNREARGRRVHDYDIVIGPVADDGVVYQLNLYRLRLISVEQLVQGLTFRRLNSRYFFGSDAAVSKLVRL